MDKIRILKTNVDRVTRAEALERFTQLMQTPELSIIVTPNSEIVLNADKNPELAQTINEAALVIPDGISLVYASKLIGQPLTERVTGIDFTQAALEWCAKNDKKVYFFGSRPGIAELAAQKKCEEIPGLQIVGTRNGYFTPEEEPEIAKQIGASGADFLCIALGSPKQELFAKRYADVLGAKVCIGIGGSLDVWSGTLQRAPEFYCKHGLEWLYRLKQEPSRFKRMAVIPTIFLKIIFRGNK